MLKKTFFCLAFISNSLFADSTLNIKAFVQGYYDKSLNQMVPVIDRFNQPNIFDTITVELHGNHIDNLAYSSKAIFSVNNNAAINIPSFYSGNYYFIVLRHRNSIATWSSEPVKITASTTYDFSTALSKAYGNNMILINGVACIYTGDINQDGVIDTIDMNMIFHDAQMFLWGYYPTDLNGDGGVDILDMAIEEININSGIHKMFPAFIMNDFIIYPNPAHISITLRSTIIENENVLFIYNSSGALVNTKYNWKNEEQIDISSLASGNYFMKLIDSDHNFVQQLIVKN